MKVSAQVWNKIWSQEIRRQVNFLFYFSRLWNGFCLICTLICRNVGKAYKIYTHHMTYISIPYLCKYCNNAITIQQIFQEYYLNSRILPKLQENYLITNEWTKKKNILCRSLRGSLFWTLNLIKRSVRARNLLRSLLYSEWKPVKPN